MAYIKVGDEVRVFYSRASLRRKFPEGFPGKVTGTGKRYGTAEFQEPWADPQGQQRTRLHEIRFDLETGMQSPDTEGFRVRTTEQADRDRRRKEALGHLHLHGIEFKIGRERHLTLEQIEALAEVVKTWNQEG